jgi:uncharacterized protein YndB with AHSA1/START domain/ketosteroid isomerase-like protein
MADSGALVLHLERVLPVEPAVAFRAHTDPSLLAKWWGPNGFTIGAVDLDLRPGGAYRIPMHPPDAEVFYLVGEFREVTAPERLVYTFEWDDPAPDDIPNVVTITYRATGAATTMTVEQRPFATEERRALHVGGWSDSLDKLAALTRAQAAPDSSSVVLAFNAAINRRDLAALGRLMADHHRFIDAAGNAVSGKPACLEAWQGFFDAFPDYRNVFDTVRSDAPGIVVVDGSSECSVPALAGPARWRAVVEGGLVVEWRVFDAPEPD